MTWGGTARFGGAMALMLASSLACHDFTADLEACARLGRCVRACTSTSECGDGLVCNTASSRCEPAPVVPPCAWPAFPPNTACGSMRAFHFSPSGDDANPGTAERPKHTATGLVFTPGDRLHLAAGVWFTGFSLNGSGRSDCPIVLEGAPDGGSVFRPMGAGAFVVRGSSWVVSDVVVEGGGHVIVSEASGGTLRDVVLRRFHVQAEARPPSMVLIERCANCVVEASTFTGAQGAEPSNALQLWTSPGFVVRGNTFAVDTVQPAIQAVSMSVDGVVLGNSFTLERPALFDSPGVVFARNVVFDVPGGTMVSGATDVVHNTFVRLGDGTAAVDARFRGNVVSVAGSPIDGVSRGHNLFHAVQRTPPLSMDDLVAGTPLLDAAFVPDERSPALDAADPLMPVPPGGGARADIGAKERGATQLADGRYCLPPDAGTW